MMNAAVSGSFSFSRSTHTTAFVAFSSFKLVVEKNCSLKTKKKVSFLTGKLQEVLSREKGTNFVASPKYLVREEKEEKRNFHFIFHAYNRQQINDSNGNGIAF